MSVSDYPFPSYDWPFHGIDFAFIPMTQEIANLMYADGIRFVGRYLFNRRFPNGKGITAEEASFYGNAGIRIYFYYEVDVGDALGGYDSGINNGINCLHEIHDIGVPDGTQIYCCCDSGVTSEQAQGVVMNYLTGFYSATWDETGIDPDTQEEVVIKTWRMSDYLVGIYGGLNVMQACYNLSPNFGRCQAGAWGLQEFSPINVRQWLVAANNRAKSEGRIRIQNINISADGYATWRGFNVDLCSAPTLENMWGEDSPIPPTPPIPPVPPIPPTPTPDKQNMPLWFYLKLM